MKTATSASAAIVSSAENSLNHPDAEAALDRRDRARAEIQGVDDVLVQRDHRDRGLHDERSEQADAGGDEQPQGVIDQPHPVAPARFCALT
ncbi:MAG: hypothetical protein M3Y17_09710 [Actinomycetota bacterium]|nr:hypothetical protein [Actinomycetota bacterium]